MGIERELNKRTCHIIDWFADSGGSYDSFKASRDEVRVIPWPLVSVYWVAKELLKEGAG
jgi:hypothetical protein